MQGNDTIASAMAQLQKLDAAINDALEHEIAETVIEYIRFSALKNVYSYSVSAQAMMKRRKGNGGLIDRKNFDRSVSEHTLTLTNIAPLQHPVSAWNGRSYTYQKLVNVVEKAIPNWNQPDKRPFMKEGRDNAITDGSVHTILMNVLKRYGFDIGFVSRR